VNTKLKEHNRSVYSAPSQRHVAEQIDALYWNIVSADDMQADQDMVVVTKDADLTQTEYALPVNIWYICYAILTPYRTIKSLPENYSDLYIHPDASSNFSEAEAGRYRTLHDRLISQAEQRDQQQQRLARYKQLQTVLEPFTNAQENVQPNLVTRDGELGKELERMRILLARVTGRVQEMKDAGVVSHSDGTTAVSNEQKLAAVMDLT
jgi:Kinetochore complex Fta4 of Sim4 subunit, or CENP-50